MASVTASALFWADRVTATARPTSTAIATEANRNAAQRTTQDRRHAGVISSVQPHGMVAFSVTAMFDQVSDERNGNGVGLRGLGRDLGRSGGLVGRIGERWARRAVERHRDAVGGVRVGVRRRDPGLERERTSAVTSRSHHAALRGEETGERDDADDHRNDERHDEDELDRDDTLVVACAWPAA